MHSMSTELLNHNACTVPLLGVTFLDRYEIIDVYLEAKHDRILFTKPNVLNCCCTYCVLCEAFFGPFISH